jgi:hypothetical protein
MRVGFHLVAAGLAYTAQAASEEVTSIESRLGQIANGELEASNEDLQALVQLRGELEAENQVAAESLS